MGPTEAELDDMLDPRRVFVWYLRDGRALKLRQDQIEWVDIDKRSWVPKISERAYDAMTDQS